MQLQSASAARTPLYTHEAPIPAKRVYRESCCTMTFYRWLERYGADAMGAVRPPGGRWLLYPSK
jgi:hypothetical protein